ncbi:MAG TPA: PTS sugar transporter subunit IIA [Rhabdochlamydiaceae bacterium]|nr:PTS sugar transporter subunit IIA [Rhabdochlamydiaceae bacterium]
MDLKIKDVADLLKVSETTIRRWLTDGKIPAYRLNHQYRFSRIEIENWMIKCKLKAADAPEFSPFDEKQELEEPTPIPNQGMQQFSFYRAIHHGGIYHDISGNTKEEIIEGTTKRIAEKMSLDADVLYELLMDREQLMPTALNHGIAVPHARDFVEGLSFDFVTVVFPKNPIAYGALDGKPVHTLFFLFATNDKTHLHLLAKLAHLSSNAKALEFLQNKPDKVNFLEYIRIWEDQLGHK